MHISDKNKANALNNFFQSVFTTDDGNLPPVSASLPASIGNIVFDQHGIEKELNRLNVNKAGGPDGIPPRILHDMFSEVAPVLTFLFQQSYDSGIVPKDWSMAMVSPIFTLETSVANLHLLQGNGAHGSVSLEQIPIS